MSNITENEIFNNIMESLFTYERIVQSYRNSPRNYGSDELLYMTEVHTIQMIGDFPGLSLNELADKTYRTKSAMSLIIKNLSAKGLVKRKRNKDDNRRYILTLTKEGEEIYKYHQEFDLKNYKEILCGLKEQTDIDINDLMDVSRIMIYLNKVLSKFHSNNK